MKGASVGAFKAAWSDVVQREADPDICRTIGEFALGKLLVEFCDFLENRTQ